MQNEDDPRGLTSRVIFILPFAFALVSTAFSLRPDAFGQLIERLGLDLPDALAR